MRKIIAVALLLSSAAYGQTPTQTPTRTPTATMTTSPTPGATPTCGATMQLAMGYCSADEWGHDLCVDDGGCSDGSPYCANDGDCTDPAFPICSGDGSNDFEVQSNTDTDPWNPVFAACNGTNSVTSVRQGTGGFGQAYSSLLRFRNPGFAGTVTGGTLRLRFGTVANDDGRNFQGEYFPWSPTCGAEDFTNAGGNNAFSELIVPGAGLGWQSASRDFALSNVNLINPADDVELRLSIDGGDNTGSNRADHVTYEHAFSAGPLLLLNIDCAAPTNTPTISPTPTNTPTVTPTPTITPTPTVTPTGCFVTLGEIPNNAVRNAAVTYRSDCSLYRVRSNPAAAAVVLVTNESEGATTVAVAGKAASTSASVAAGAVGLFGPLGRRYNLSAEESFTVSVSPSTDVFVGAVGLPRGKP